MKVIIAGCRDFNDLQVVADAIAASGFKVTEVISGGATGVDTLGERWAEITGLGWTRYPADWERHGRAAGPIRNRQMAECADALVAVWDGQSRGTKNMIETMRALGKPVYVHLVGAVEASRD